MTDTAFTPTCMVCGATMRVFHEQSAVPVNSCLLVSDEHPARAFPCGAIALGFCDACGCIRNVAFDPVLTEYSGRYEGTQAYSGTFNTFQKRLATSMVERHGIRGKRVVEIGCGKGEFLAMLCASGGNSGVGYDPSFEAQRHVPDTGVDVRFVADYFGQDYARADADVVVCRMTLEHIERCAEFVATLRSALIPDPPGIIVIQVPECTRIFRDCAFEDIYYEHCSYFTPDSLNHLIASAGFDIEALEIQYAGQYLTIAARLDNAATRYASLDARSIEELAALVDTFSERRTAKIDRWRSVVEKRRREGPLVIWGSGSKGVAFLHALGDCDAVSAAVDINPHRHGHYMLGTGQPIVSPAMLTELGPRTIIAMNPVYRAEIQQSLDTLGITADLLAL